MFAGLIGIRIVQRGSDDAEHAWQWTQSRPFAAQSIARDISPQQDLQVFSPYIPLHCGGVVNAVQDDNFDLFLSNPWLYLGCSIANDTPHAWP